MGYNANRQQPISMKVDRVSNPSDKILDYAYEYYDQNGKNNNRIRKAIDNIDPAGASDYFYDDYNRLEKAITGGYTRNYSYDAWGNTTNFAGETYAYATNGSGAPATNRIGSSSQIANFSYDAAGNMTQAGSATYGYDGAGRLKSVNGTANTYGYDGNGARVRVTDAGAAVFYVRSSVLGQVTMEVTSTGVRRAYVYSSGGKLIAQQSTDGQFYWLHTNHLNSARAMTDVNGNLVYKGQFDPYGKALTQWSSSGNTSLNTRKFTGYERDATGLDYAGARMYNSGRGRFMTPDIKGLESANVRKPQTLNRYSYTYNDPINHIDPSGLVPREEVCDWIYRYDEETGKLIGATLLCRNADEETRPENPSDGGGNQVQYFDPPNWADYLNQLLSQETCNKFLSEFQAKLGSLYSLDMVLGWTNVKMETVIGPGARIMSGRNFFDQGRMEVHITPKVNTFTNIPGGAPPYERRKAEYEYATTLVHELLHFSTFGTNNFSHTDFRNAVLALNEPLFKDIYEELKVKVEKGDITQSMADTQLFESAFQIACLQP